MDQDLPQIHWRISEWFSDLSPETLGKLKLYQEKLVEANRTLSLISPKTIFFADALHFADSILASRLISPQLKGTEKVFDLGSGAGFPGLIYGLLNPKTEVVLVEADLKKADFLNQMISLLKTPNVSVLAKTIESLPENSIQIALCRGLSTISKTLLITRKQVSKGGVIFHLKAEEWGIEVGEIPIQLCSHWSPGLLGDYKLPIGAIKFSIVKTDKIT